VAKPVEVFSTGKVPWEIVLIFLTVGNWHKGFDRLVQAVDDFVQRKIISEKVIAQVGSGTYKPKHLASIDYCSPTEFIDYLEKSKVVIAHAGVGTIGQAIKLEKPIVVVPRKAELGECSNNHQWTTAKQLEEEGKILAAYEISELPDKLQQARSFVSAKKQMDNEIIQTIEKFIDELAVKKYGDVK
jgi:UDP-N-acetylglucosamine transferase subunit ALG13